MENLIGVFVEQRGLSGLLIFMMAHRAYQYKKTVYLL